MDVAAIIPTRGEERKMFVQHQITRAVSMGYPRIFLVDHPPVKNVVDIYQRVAKGVERARAEGFEWVSIIEDDDHYLPDYLERVKMSMKDNELVGFSTTTYYHIFKQDYRKMVHPGRSSLFTTSFKTEVFKEFYPNPPGYFDISLWSDARRLGLNTELIASEYALGIKHGIGLCGGNGHYFNLGTKDPDLNFFKSWFLQDPSAYQFYMDLINKLKPSWQQLQQSQKTR